MLTKNDIFDERAYLILHSSIRLGDHNEEGVGQNEGVGDGRSHFFLHPSRRALQCRCLFY